MASTIFDDALGTPIVASWLNDVNAKTYGINIDGYINLYDNLSVVDKIAVKNYTSVVDHTALINTALSLGKRVYLPAGLWNVNTDVGIVIPTGGSIIGDGLMKTIIKAAATGGSTAELVAYTKGSVIKRAFTVGIANSYVTGCYLADFSVQLNHPAYNVGNYKQIGIDLRNMSRTFVERVHVGTLGVPGQTVCPAPSAVDACQGYGIVVGTRTSGITDYCGGEVNTIRDVMTYGAYKGIVLDDDVLTPLSAAHATLVDNVDVQGCHELIAQKLQFAAGSRITNAVIQNNYRQSGNANPTIGVQLGGQNGSAHIKYAEVGGACDLLFNCTNASKNNTFTVDYYSSLAPGVAAISDSSPGNRNKLTYPAAVSRVGTGALVQFYNGAPTDTYYKGFFTGATETVVQASGLTVTRNSTGNYTMHNTIAQPNMNWLADVFIDADASGHIGGVAFSYGTQSTTDLQFFTYSQNAGTSTSVDPRMMMIRVKQAI